MFRRVFSSLSVLVLALLVVIASTPLLPVGAATDRGSTATLTCSGFTLNYAFIPDRDNTGYAIEHILYRGRDGRGTTIFSKDAYYWVWPSVVRGTLSRTWTALSEFDPLTLEIVSVAGHGYSEKVVFRAQYNCHVYPSGTPTVTPTPYPSGTPTATPSATPTFTPLPTETLTVTPTEPPTITPTFTISPTPLLPDLYVVSAELVNYAPNGVCLTNYNSWGVKVQIGNAGRVNVGKRFEVKVGSEIHSWPDIDGEIITTTFGSFGTIYVDPTNQIVESDETNNVYVPVMPSITPTSGPMCTYTPTVTPTASMTRTITRTPSITPTPTITMTPSITVTGTNWPTGTPTQTFTPSRTFTPSVTPSVTASRTPMATRTITPTRTPTASPQVSLTPTARPPSATPIGFPFTRTPVSSATPLPSATATDVPPTGTPVPSATPTGELPSPTITMLPPTKCGTENGC